MKSKLNFNEIKTKYQAMDAWGLLTSIDLHNCNPELIRNEAKIKQYVDEICKLFGFKKFGECVVVYFGEKETVAGFSMTQLIETSLISGHFANLTNAAYIDIFSCKLYDSQKAAEFSKEFFMAGDYNLQIALRK